MKNGQSLKGEDYSVFGLRVTKSISNPRIIYVTFLKMKISELLASALKAHHAGAAMTGTAIHVG